MGGKFVAVVVFSPVGVFFSNLRLSLECRFSYPRSGTSARTMDAVRLTTAAEDKGTGRREEKRGEGEEAESGWQAGRWGGVAG